MAQTPIIRVEQISKSFSSTKALSGVSLEVFPGQVRGLIGENGSGKSTLAAIISGNLPPDEGAMYFMGEPYKPKNSFEASEKGITMIVQEQGTISTISAAANIFAGRESRFCKFGLLDKKALNREAKELLEKIGSGHIQPESIAGGLSFEDRKMVEIARAFFKTPELFIVDETTTALPNKERNTLYNIIKELKSAGKAVLFISHDIDELIEVCDSISILRDGVYIDTLGESQMEPRRMKELMVGREVADSYYRSDSEASCSSEEAVLSFENVSAGQLKDISFELKKGEILGICGLSDCGMHELGKIAFGREKPESGAVRFRDGTAVSNPTASIRRKVSYVPKNRDSESLLGSASIKDNITLPSLDRIKKLFFIWPGTENRFSEKWSAALRIKMRDIHQKCHELSGGNKQKVVLAKWLGNGSELFIMDCPTRGIDIGVKESIYRMMEDLKAEGKSIIMISEELPEIIGMSDRILAMRNGEITGSFERSDSLREVDIIQHMI